MFLFGSAAKGQLNERSDLDFAVLFKENLAPIERDEAFFEVRSGLQKMFTREIDVVSYNVLKNSVFKSELDNAKVALYAA